MANLVGIDGITAKIKEIIQKIRGPIAQVTKRLLDFVSDYISREKGSKVSIGIINENTILKKLYQDYGFVETALQKFPHVPFTVCMMEKEVAEC